MTSSKFSQLSWHIPLETELVSLFLGIVIIKFKITETLQTAMTNLQNSMQMSTHTNCIMHKVYSKLDCTQMPPRLFSKLKTASMLIGFYNFR